MHNENKHSSRMVHNEKSDNNKLEKRAKVRAALVGVAMTGAGLGIATAMGEAIHHNDAVAPEVAAAAEITHEQNGNVDEQLAKIQDALNSDSKDTLDELQWVKGPQYSVTVEPGGGIVVDSLAAYENVHHLASVDEIPASVKDSINITGKNYVEALRAQGADGVIQPGTVLTLTEMIDENNIEHAIVSSGGDSEQPKS